MRRYKKKNAKFIIWMYIINIVFILVISIPFVIYGYFVLTGQTVPDFLLLFSVISPKEKDNIIAAFNTLWTVAVTVTIFILEISEKYKYGVSLKRIVYSVLGIKKIVVGAGLFMLLFPLFYLCMKLGWMHWGLLCLSIAFLLFVDVNIFFTWTYRGKNIREVIYIKTREQIMELMADDKAENTNKRKKNENKDEIYLHEKIDGFAISDMLDHVSYGNVDEVSGIVSVCSKIFSESQLWDDLPKSPLGNLLITTWVDHIIHSCDWETEFDCVQNVNTMHFIWKRIIKTIPEDKKDSERQVSVSLQFLQPFVNENDMKSSQLLVRIWREFGVYRKQVLVYLLLYTTYRSYRADEIDYTWILQEQFEFQVCMQEILNGYFWWNEKFAMRCWLDWSLYDCHNDISLTKFMEFSKDIDRLREGKRYMVRSPILIRAVGGIK